MSTTWGSFSNNDSDDAASTAIRALSPTLGEGELEDAVLTKSGTISLRPTGFGDYLGQEEIKKTLELSCSAAKARKEALDHILLHGPPGLGKTSLARIIAKELGVGFRSTSGPVIERPGDLAAMLSALQEKDVFFIDEIHRLPRIVEEVLYPALEDYEIDIVIGQGAAAKSVKVPLKPFTLIGATTRTSLLTSPLRDRFGIIQRLEYYSPKELAAIVKRSAALLELKTEDAANLEIGKRARGTPRIANRILRRVRDVAQDKGSNNITLEIAQETLNMLGVDEVGLDSMDRKILETIIEKYNGGPVGVETIAASIGEDKDTVEDVYEPFLLQEGFIARTKQGRTAMESAYLHLNKKPR